MKVLIPVLIICLFIPVMSTPAFAGEEVASIADLFKGSSDDWREQYIQQVDKNVQLAKELEDCESVRDDMDARNDTIALAVATGIFIGSGGITAAVPVVGGIINIPFILLGF